MPVLGANQAAPNAFVRLMKVAYSIDVWIAHELTPCSSVEYVWWMVARVAAISVTVMRRIARIASALEIVGKMGMEITTALRIHV